MLLVKSRNAVKSLSPCRVASGEPSLRDDGITFVQEGIFKHCIVQMPASQLNTKRKNTAGESVRRPRLLWVPPQPGAKHTSPRRAPEDPGSRPTAFKNNSKEGTNASV